MPMIHRLRVSKASRVSKVQLHRRKVQLLLRLQLHRRKVQLHRRKVQLHRRKATKANRVTKVDKANSIYDFCFHVAAHCLKSGIGFTIENPTNSYLWLLPEYQLLGLEHGVQKVNFLACMWEQGGTRKPRC